MEETNSNQSKQNPEPKKKMATWAKGLIALGLVAVVGGGVYFGAQGGLFQGRMFKFSNVKRVKTVESIKAPVDSFEGMKIKPIEVTPVIFVNPLSVSIVENLPGYTAYSSNGDLYGQFDVTNFYNTNSSGTAIYLLVFKVEVDAGAADYDLSEVRFEYTDANGGTGSQVCFGGGVNGDDLMRLNLQNGDYGTRNEVAEDGNENRVFEQNSELDSIYTGINSGQTKYFAIEGNGLESCVSGETKATITSITFTDSEGRTISPSVDEASFDRTIYWQ